MGYDINLTDLLLIIIAAEIGVFTIAYLYTLMTVKPKRSGASGDSQGVLERLKNEPALLGGLITTGGALMAAFGLELSAGQVAAISAFFAALLAVAVRQVVTPVRKIK